MAAAAEEEGRCTHTNQRHTMSFVAREGLGVDKAPLISESFIEGTGLIFISHLDDNRPEGIGPDSTLMKHSLQYKVHIFTVELISAGGEVCSTIPSSSKQL